MPGEDAQLWFTDPARRAISTTFDDRETTVSRHLNAALTVALVPDARVILDVGCGGGEMLADIRSLATTPRLIGVDPVTAAVADARRRHAGDPHAAFLVGSAEDLPSLPAPPDVAVSHLNLGLWRDPLAGLTGILSVLADGGCLFIVDVAAARSPEDRERFLGLARTQDERRYLADQIDAAHSPESLGRLLHDALSETGRDAQVHIGQGGLAGYPFNSPEAASLFSSAPVRSAVAEFPATDSSGADAVLNAVVRLR